MYAKIFESIYNSSIANNYLVRLVFIDMLVLSDADGILNMTHEALARRTGVPLDVVREAISVLESEDPDSNSPEENGRRIVRIDDRKTWGWQVVNKQQYRSMHDPAIEREKTRERVRRFREARKQAGDVTPGNAQVTGSNTPVTPITDNRSQIADSKSKKVKNTSASASEFGAEFLIAWAEYPRKKGRDEALRHYSRHRKEGVELSTLLAAVKNYKREIEILGVDERYVKHGSTFFNKDWRDYAPDTWTPPKTKSSKHEGLFDDFQFVPFPD